MHIHSTFFVALLASLPLLAAENCTLSASTPPPLPAAHPVQPATWLNPGNIRFSLGQAERFMPGVSLMLASAPPARSTAARRLDPERPTLVDPADGTRRSLRFMLENRIDADGVLILHRGKTVFDYRRSGFDPAQPRLLLEATRPILVAQLAKAAAEGRLVREKAITRLIPDLGAAGALGKLSLQRLLDGRTGLTWSDAESARWHQEAGWAPGGTRGVRAWMLARQAWPRSDGARADLNGPEGALLLWAVEKAWRRSAPESLCALMLTIRARNAAFWASDAHGTPLADGLALSLEDFASLGQAFLDARKRPGRRAVVPAWFVDSVANPSETSAASPAAVRALGPDTGWQYRMAHPGRRGHRLAIIGAYGTSLFVDFDHGAVIAIYASHAERHAPLMMASLRTLWDGIAQSGDVDDGLH